MVSMMESMIIILIAMPMLCVLSVFYLFAENGVVGDCIL
jgi:hypothetical protein